MTDQILPARKRRLVIELAALFVAVPAVYALLMAQDFARGVSPLLVLAVFTTCIAVRLWRDPTFDRGSVTRVAGLKRAAVGIGALFIVGTALMVAVVLWLAPDRFLTLPRTRPGLWLAVMLLYPLLSVVPQELIYRSFFHHRYRPLFGKGLGMIVASATAFAWMHVLFLNVIAVALTLVGGVLFAYRYERTRSLPVVCLEHTLYGQLVFTIGLGEFLYHGGTNGLGG